jgi:hypothetical protein
MKYCEASVALDAIGNLLINPQPKSVMFTYALVRNRRALEPPVRSYRMALLTCDDEMAADWSQREVTLADELLMFSLTWFPAETSFDNLDALYPLIVGPPE